MTNIKTLEQQQEYNDIRDGLKCYIYEKISRSLNKYCIITTNDIKKNFNSGLIRYTQKLAEELIKEMQRYYKIEVKEEHLTFGQTTKKYFEYIC
jgi:hypothetical protein